MVNAYKVVHFRSKIMESFVERVMDLKDLDCIIKFKLYGEISVNKCFVYGDRENQKFIMTIL